MSDDAVLRVLWGKAAGEEAHHPLLCHMIDVGSVARALLEEPDAAHLVLLLARLLGVEPRHVPRLVAYLIAMHDLGKASPSFQAKSPAHWKRVEAVGLGHGPRPIEGFSHGLESYLILADLLPELRLLELPARRSRRHPAIGALALALGAHHGVFFTDSYPGTYPEVPGKADGREPWREPWRAARAALVAELRRAFLEEGEPIACDHGNLSALCVALNGLAILCDWIGSDTTHFPPYSGSLASYPTESFERARRALAARQLLRYLPRRSQACSFGELFPGLSARPLQEALTSEALPELPEQALVIVEAPTGEGKTEAALLLANRLAAAEGCRGFYFALPTVATSNQMYERVRRFLACAVGEGERAALMLVNGQAEFSEEFAQALDRASHQQRDDGEEVVVADAWLLPRKRSLLSPYGVGTVDQAMLGALNVRHVALRLLGLAGKVLIVDEVHAYDLYMSTIIDRLLRWLHALGASVILLSATLPRCRRQRLLEAYTGRAGERDSSTGTAALDPYPLVTVADGASGELKRITPLAAQPGRQVQIERRLDGEGQRVGNARFLLDEVREGGAACWLVNTVREAQDCYEALKAEVAKLPNSERPDLVLFHARFLLWRRRQIEEEVVGRLGPEGDRQRPLVLVATQVVEQSLDLDFDLLMTQLAPIDLLLQRAGRLHRHNRRRPPRLAAARLVLLLPPRAERDRPIFGGTGLVYAPFVLLRTLVALHGKESIAVPAEVRSLIEAVYGDNRSDPDELRQAGIDPALLAETLGELRLQQDRQEQEAIQRLLREPDGLGRFHLRPGLPFDDEAAEQQPWVAAETRLAQPSVRLVILEEGSELADALQQPKRRLTAEETKEALLHSVSVAKRQVVEYVTGSKGDPRVVPLEQHRGLEGHYLLLVRQGTYVWPDGSRRRRLAVSPELGVTIDSEED